MDYLTAFIFSKNKISNYFSSIKETNNFGSMSFRVGNVSFR